MKSSVWRGSFSEHLTALRQHFGDEAVDVRHELFYLAAGKTSLAAGLRAFGALLRDAWLLLLRAGPGLPVSAGRQAILLTTLHGASGWGTLERSLPALALAGYERLILAHPRLSSKAFPSNLQVARPARAGVADLLSSLRVLVDTLLLRRPLLLACCLARRRLWQGSLRRTLANSRGVLLLHNDFDLMSRAAINKGLPAICLQHGVPTDEFFPTRADWYLIWGGSSRQAFDAVDSRSSRLVEDALGRGQVPLRALEAPDGLALLSQTHAYVLGDRIDSALREFADALLKRAPQARILLHPLEREPYTGPAALATRHPPHPELQPGACAPRLVMGYCSTAMLDAALAGHWVVALQLPLDGNHAARSVLAAPLRAATAEQAVAVYRRLREDAEFRREAAEAQAQWLRASFSSQSGGLTGLLERIDQPSSAACTQ